MIFNIESVNDYPISPLSIDEAFFPFLLFFLGYGCRFLTEAFLFFILRFTGDFEMSLLGVLELLCLSNGDTATLLRLDFITFFVN